MATISITKVSPDLKELLEGFQVKAAKVLANHFLKAKVPQNYIEALERHLEDQKRIVLLEADNKEMRPKADVADIVMGSKGAIRVGTFAKTVPIDGKIMGQNRMFEYLRRSGILIAKQGEDRNKTYQRYMDNGWFTSRLHVIDRANRKTLVSLITNKGIVGLIQKMKNDPLFDGIAVSVNHGVEQTTLF